LPDTQQRIAQIEAELGRRRRIAAIEGELARRQSLQPAPVISQDRLSPSLNAEDRAVIQPSTAVAESTSQIQPRQMPQIQPESRLSLLGRAAKKVGTDALESNVVQSALGRKGSGLLSGFNRAVTFQSPESGPPLSVSGQVGFGAGGLPAIMAGMGLLKSAPLMKEGFDVATKFATDAAANPTYQSLLKTVGSKVVESFGRGAVAGTGISAAQQAVQTGKVDIPSALQGGTQTGAFVAPLEGIGAAGAGLSLARQLLGQTAATVPLVHLTGGDIRDPEQWAMLLLPFALSAGPLAKVAGERLSKVARDRGTKIEQLPVQEAEKIVGEVLKEESVSVELRDHARIEMYQSTLAQLQSSRDSSSKEYRDMAARLRLSNWRLAYM